ncbi:hypothetical protein PQ455_12480 [Sphingomonas naphthae]|uniref:Uncharacterized protein n=1 Tax=Sphingomonas naphthae TaxID=1813468 RepID=A0ABY7THN3_9SPHN|nr:hypothetical protein [Sphingomonas naphthae]WCT72450.1 hypothetical protein PQ455_12480 [Sphingomonas naphthae]
MLHESGDEHAWFAPKRFGYGAGLPIRWQGWAVLAAYVGVMTGSTGLLPVGTLPAIGAGVLMVVATVLLVVIAKRRTRGGWKWRSGGD